MLERVIDRFEWSRFDDEFARAADLGGFRSTCLATTAAGLVRAWEKPGSGPTVYLSSGIHGDEPAGPLALLELMRSGVFGPQADWIICPALNPTGLAAGTRENAEGMDLNRDYWARRYPEVSSHAAWLEAGKVPQLFISLHEDWETTGFYFYEINCGKDQPERASAILEAVRPWFAAEPCRCIDDHEVRDPGWIYHAAEADLPECWPEAIFLAKLGCPVSFTFETPSRASLADRVQAHQAAVRSVLERVVGLNSPSAPEPLG